jgi:hypothetical protein
MTKITLRYLDARGSSPVGVVLLLIVRAEKHIL